jgi:23S rRNA (uracil1939-C5)-methyltransferase
MPAPASTADSSVRVTALASDGDGIARLASGRVVFVEGAVPGDLVELGPTREQGRLLRAGIAWILEPSPDRVEPRCAYFGRCGGCLWQHIRYAAQLEAKRANVRAALERIGGLRLEAEIGIVPSPDAYHYRARTRVVETEGGVGYRRRASNDVLAVDACPVLVPAAQAALTTLGRRVSTAPRERTDAPRSARFPRPPREWVITAGSRGEARTSAPGDGDRERGVALGAGREKFEASAEPIFLEVSGERLRVAGPGFIQGNALLWERFAGEVVDRCRLPIAGRPPARFVELYAGIGFFTLPLARRGLTGLAVESDRGAVADLGFNLAQAGLADAVEVVGAEVEGRPELETWLAQADLLLVDPPRVGLERRVCDAIARRGPAAVVYVSCDPATLARDLRTLVGAGYRIASVLALDLFPQTPHVEAIVRLER